MALALPAASVPPIIVQKTRMPQLGQSTPALAPGRSRVARTMAGTVVTSRSSIMRGLVSATYARIVSAAEGAVAPDSVPVRLSGRPAPAPAPVGTVARAV